MIDKHMINKYYNQSFRLKTEKAIESVNHYELMKEDFRFRLQSIQDQLKKHHFKMLTEGNWAKMQLVSDSAQLYELIYEEKKKNQKIETNDLVLKIVIKSFTGKVVHLSLSPKPQIVKLALCEYKISDQRIIKVRNPILSNNRTYLTLHSPADLIVFKMKYEFVVEEEATMKESLKSSSLQLLKIKSSRYASKERLRESDQKEEMLISLKKGRNGSPRSLLDRSRTSSAKAENFIKQKERILMARQKRNDLQLYRQKSKSLRSLSHQCTGILKEYQAFLTQEDLKKRELLKKLVTLLQAVTFLKATQSITMARQQGLSKVKNTKANIKKCIKKFIKLTENLKVIQPNSSRRQLLAVYYHSTQIARTLLKEDCNKAKNILKSCLDSTFVGMSINKAFQRSAAYRTKVRVIQRFWKSRNSAQVSLFKEYILSQLSELLSKHLYFGLVRQEFFNRNMPEHLAWQYLTESSLKIKKIVANYYGKLREIEEIIKINSQIKEFNSKALKKHQKPLLQVPTRPCYPVSRYFRDLNILKAMLRSWLEIEYRRHVRKLKKEGKSLPKNMKIL